MKKLLIISLILTLFLISFASAIKPSHYNNCEYWTDENGNWTWCERGTYFEKLNIDNQGKGHTIFHNVGQLILSLNGNIIIKDTYQDIFSAQTPAGRNPNYYYDWNTFIFKSERNYEFWLDKVCIYSEFTKETNDKIIFDRVKYICYPLN